MNDGVILVGGFHEIIELCRRCGKEIVGIIDNNLRDEYLGYKILGTDGLAGELYKEYADFPVIISPDSPAMRIRLVEYYKIIGYRFTGLISPKANISESAQIGAGVIIQDGVNVSSASLVGDFVKLNTYANVMHDVVVRDWVTVAPNAVLLGRVCIGEATYIGANSTVLAEKNVGRNAVIGAGAVVTKDVGDGITVVGNPARPLSK